MPNKIDRRQLIKYGTSTMGIAGFGGLAFYQFNKVGLGVCYGSGQFKKSDGSNSYFFVLCDLDRDELRPIQIATDFLPHGININPAYPKRIMLFEKKGPGCCEIDIETGTVIRKIKTEIDRYFYGHGAFTKDGTTILNTEAYIEKRDGVVAVREYQSMKIVDYFPTYGKNPHDCKLIENDSVFVVTNGGGTFGKGNLANVSYIDVKTKKLLDQVPINNKKLNAGHLGLSSKLDLVVISAPRDGLDTTLPGGITFRPSKQKILQAKADLQVLNSMKSETLSLTFQEERQMVAASNPLGNIITFWNYKTGEYMGKISIQYPRSLGISLNQKYLLVGHGKNAALSFINLRTMKIEKTLSNMGFSGSHLTIFDKKNFKI